MSPSLRHVRINDLARELGIKCKYILVVLPFVGITGNKNHSSSLNLGDADSVRAYFREHPAKVPEPKVLQASARTAPGSLPQTPQRGGQYQRAKTQGRATNKIAMAEKRSASPRTRPKKRKKRRNKSRFGGSKQTKSKSRDSGVSRIYGWLERGGWPYNS